MFDELSFLFQSSEKVKNQFNNSTDASRSNLNNVNNISNKSNSVQSVDNRIEYDDEVGEWRFNKYTVTKSSVKNYIRSNINSAYQTNGKNPYLQLIEDFNGTDKNKKSLKIKPSDLTYLRDIGVFPINRLMILRRFPEGVVVPNDLNDLNVEPISTVIGWIKAEDDMLNYSANEEWKTQQKWLHELIQEIIQNEFGIDIAGIFPIPGWGQGFMFGILNKLGLTEYDSDNLPIGDANLLREGVTRPHEEQGLKSSFKFNLETVYEQKIIGGMDAGSALEDIHKNVLRMATSNIKYLGKPGTELIKKLSSANNNPSNPNGWGNLIVEFVETVVSALKGTFIDTVKTNANTQNNVKKTNEDSGVLNGIPTETDTEENSEDTQTKKNKNAESALDNLNKIGVVQKLIKTILASTVARYQWPIRGAISQLTGEAATPWHLTIGNPYAPLLSMSNIKVSSVDVTFGNELAYNDMSKFMTVKISMEQGRNMGKQEIENMFGIEYRRKYKKNK